MKLKKWIALALSAVMALGVLTACGGGSGGSVDIDEVNKLIAEAKSEITVTSSGALDSAVSSIADGVKTKEDLDTKTINSKLWEKRKYAELDEWDVLTGVKVGAVYAFSAADIETGISASEIAAKFNLSSSSLGNLGTINTPERVLAAAVLGIDSGVDAYVTSGLNSYLPSDAQAWVNMVLSRFSLDVSGYTVSGERVRIDDAYYWLLAVELTVSLTPKTA